MTTNRTRQLTLTRCEATEKADSDGTDVAGVHKKRLAKDVNDGIWLPNVFLEYFRLSDRLIIRYHTHQNLETSGLDSVSIVFWTSFVARDLYRQSSSAIELELFAVYSSGFCWLRQNWGRTRMLIFLLIDCSKQTKMIQKVRPMKIPLMMYSFDWDEYLNHWEYPSTLVWFFFQPLFALVDSALRILLDPDMIRTRKISAWETHEVERAYKDQIELIDIIIDILDQLIE